MFPMPVLCTYIAFGAGGLAMYHFIAEQHPSSILTLAVIMQAMAISFLCFQVVWSRSARGISVGALILDGFSVAGRIPATTWSEGYLPSDKSGDYLYQMVDFGSLILILFLLHRVLVVYRSSYAVSEDGFRVTPIIIASCGLAILVRGNAADNPLYDTCWMAGLFMGSVAVLPKLWLVQQTGGVAQAWTCHYITAMALSRALSGLFMWEAWEDMTCFEWIKGFNHSIIFVLGAHLLHICLLADFLYSYAGAMKKGIYNMELVTMHTVPLPFSQLSV